MTICFMFNPLDAASLKTSDAVTVDQDDTAKIWCEADANPITPDMFTWTRPGYNMKRATIVSQY